MGGTIYFTLMNILSPNGENVDITYIEKALLKPNESDLIFYVFVEYTGEFYFIGR